VARDDRRFLVVGHLAWSRFIRPKSLERLGATSPA
jgi:hypothetical protein